MAKYFLYVCFAPIVALALTQGGDSNTVPQCNVPCNEFQAVKERLEDERLKRLMMQNDVEKLMLEVGLVKRTVDKMKQAGLDQPQWEAWSSWSDCHWNCSGDNGGRVQSRTRKRCPDSDPCNNDIECNESEWRPCNAVQYEGCKVTGAGNELYGLAYNYYDEMAQSICTSVSQETAYITAVRRNCGGGQSCTEVCQGIRDDYKCFNAVHVYQNLPALEETSTGAVGLQTFIYNSCTGSFCGPNFCCCSRNRA